MVGRAVISLSLSVLIGVGLTAANAENKERLRAEDKAPKAVVHGVPGSLDSFYPPKAQQPIYLARMFRLGSLFSAMVADLAEGDLDGARGLFEEFKTDYVEISKSVPEWKKEYPVGPVEALGAALKVGDPKKVMVAHGKVAEVCHNCHAAYMAPVHQRYHWGDFSAIRVKDPLSDEDVPFGRLNQYLDANFAGIALNLERGHRERARKQFQGFNARFQALKTTCKTCHAGQMRHYVDETVQGLVDNLGAALDTPSSDPSSMTDLIRKIGMESCFKCHLVHVPAAFAKSKGRRGTAATP